MSGYMVTIEDAKRTDFDDYYKIRCGKSDRKHRHNMKALRKFLIVGL